MVFRVKKKRADLIERLKKLPHDSSTARETHVYLIFLGDRISG